MLPRAIALSFFVLTAAAVAAGDVNPVDRAAHAAEIESWRAQRLAGLTAADGWLTLVGLYWLKPGENTLGREPGNTIVLDHPGLARKAGSFVLEHDQARFKALTDAGVTLDGEPVTQVNLKPDTSGAPTVLASGTLRFLIIERAGRLGVRVRDVEHPLRTHFPGLDNFPVDAEWARLARFHAYVPAKRIPIVNVLGMIVDMDSPGYLTFEAAGREWRLDALSESADSDELFLMFADATSGRESYGAGRFLYVPLPVAENVLVDFNKAYNPPCAFNEFATCPLPPQQNRLTLRIEAGERSYQAAH
jgi:uncharacterized protein (DUF1684 family)